MTSQTGIPELVVGTIALYGFWWLGVPAIKAYGVFYPTLTDTALILNLAGIIFIFATWLLIGGYLYLTVLERVGFWGYKQYKQYKKNQKDVL